MTPEGWLRRKAKDFAARSKVINTAGELLPPLSITKGKGVILQSDKYKKQIATDLRKYVIARRDQFAFDPMSLYYGAIGQVTSPEIGLVSPDYVVFDVDRSVHKPFMNFLLRSPEQVALYEAVAETGNQFGKRRRVYWSVFEDLEVTLPPLGEQQKIAAILSSVDDAIEATQAVIDQLQVVKKAMMAEFLTRGLPGRHTRFKQTEIGEVPGEWEVTTLELLCSHIVDCPHETPDYVQTGYFAIRTADVVPGRILLTQARRVSSETYLKRIRRLVPESGDVLYSREGERFGIAAPVPQGVKLCLGQRMMQFRASSETDSSFLNWLLNSPTVYRQAMDEVGGSTSPHVNIKSIRKFTVVRPPIMEQRQIATALNVLSDREGAEAATIDVLRATKSALSSVLLTGELRVTPDQDPL